MQLGEKRRHIQTEEFIFSISPSAQLVSRGADGFSLSRSDLHNTDRWTQVIELARWSEKRKENEFPSELGKDGNGKGYIIYFSHWNNYRINLSFPCDSPLNPLYRNEFGVPDSVEKENWDLLMNKTMLPMHLCGLLIWIPWPSPTHMSCLASHRWCNTNVRVPSAITGSDHFIESQHYRRGKSNFTVHSVVNVLL